jgi:hypothetical protein
LIPGGNIFKPKTFFSIQVNLKVRIIKEGDPSCKKAFASHTVQRSQLGSAFNFFSERKTGLIFEAGSFYPRTTLEVDYIVFCYRSQKCTNCIKII